MKRILLALPFLLPAGCVIRATPLTYTLPSVEVASVAVEAPPADDPPVVETPEVVEVAPPGGVIVVEPAIAVREYVYDPGFPPGCYLSGGFYWYGGYRYDHEFFHEYAARDFREGRCRDRERNHREAAAHQAHHEHASRSPRGGKSNGPRGTHGPTGSHGTGGHANTARASHAAAAPAHGGASNGGGSPPKKGSK